MPSPDAVVPKKPGDVVDTVRRCQCRVPSYLPWIPRLGAPSAPRRRILRGPPGVATDPASPASGGLLGRDGDRSLRVLGESFWGKCIFPQEVNRSDFGSRLLAFEACQFSAAPAHLA